MAKSSHSGVPCIFGSRSFVAAVIAASTMSQACSDTSFPTSGPSDGAPEITAQAEAPLPVALASKAQPIPGQYIITFADSVSDVPGLAKRIANQYGNDPIFTYSSALKGFAARIPAQALDGLSHNPQIARIEPDQTVELSGAQHYADWGLDRLDQRALPLDDYFNWTSDGAGVNVYIIDSGIRGTHTDFGGRVVSAFTAVNDGYGTGDCLGHGTHVAGTVGGATWGVAKGVRLYSVRVADCAGSSTGSALLAGMDWVAKNRVLPAVANMSLGGSFSTTLNNAALAMINAGVVTVAAAGNSAIDACTVSPASLPGAITVAASTAFDVHASFSNFGSCVDLYAPGMSIQSASNTSDIASVVKTGTSMAAPHVAGAAALYLAQNPTATPSIVEAALVQNATNYLLTSVPSGTANRLLYIGSTTSTQPAPTPAPQPPPPPADTTTPPPPAPSPTPAPTDLAPVAAFKVTCTGNKGSCNFDASAAKDDVGITGYSWNFGDGTTSTSSSAAVVSHAYSAAKTYSVTLTVTDARGQSGTAQLKITVKMGGKN
jgi:subtilisin family serine protease